MACNVTIYVLIQLINIIPAWLWIIFPWLQPKHPGVCQQTQVWKIKFTCFQGMACNVTFYVLIQLINIIPAWLLIIFP